MSNSRNWPMIGAHGMTFGVGGYHKHTWTDWSLLPVSIPTFAPAVPALSLETVPGASGAIDYTEALTGAVPFQNRQGSFEFIVLPDQAYETAKSEIAQFLAGKTLNCILDDDPNYFYSGRFWVNDAASNRGYGTIVISYEVDPYKYSVATVNLSNVWSYNLNALKYHVIELDTSESLTLINPSATGVKMKVTTTAGISISKGGTTESCPEGTKTTTMALSSGSNSLTITGATAYVRIEVLLDKSL